MTEGVERRAPRVVAFYLPQFHPIPENDRWWGVGFTEWRNVIAARPQYRGHNQPRVPTDLGYYDLRVPEVREAQARLATSHGISAFCYYHYWFDGHRLLERPLQDVLDGGCPELPFMICWANENWTRLWNGGDRSVLMAQRYSADDDERHIRALLPVLGDPRYLRVDGRPAVLIYRVDQLPDPAATADRWRSVADRAGLGLYLAFVQSSTSLEVTPEAVGFDAAVQFLPQRPLLGRRLGWEGPGRRALRRTVGRRGARTRHSVFEYDELVRESLAASSPPYVRYPCVVTDWDNSSRNPHRGARILTGSTPAKFQRWMEATIEAFQPHSPTEDLIFVNAWNEWAEGAYLEPDERWGHGYLKAVKQATDAASGGLGR